MWIAMSEPLKWLLLYSVGVVAGFINVMAGGGSTMTMPILIFLGLDSAAANGTNRVAILIQNIAAISSFQSEKRYQFKTVLKYAAWTLPGAIIGALAAVRIENELFEKILGIVIIGVMFTVLLPQKKAAETPKDAKNAWMAYPALFGIGFYGGFIQAGVGFLLMAALMHILQLDLIKVNMYKVFIIFIYTIPAILIFALSGNIQIFYALALAAGNATGAWWSAKLAVKKGEKIIRLVLFFVVLAMALKLFDIY
jgi:uncharacterized protein